MDNFQLSISLSQKLSERQREERGQTDADVCDGNEAGGGQMRKIRQRQEGELMLA